MRDSSENLWIFVFAVCWRLTKTDEIDFFVTESPPQYWVLWEPGMQLPTMLCWETLWTSVISPNVLDMIGHFPLVGELVVISHYRNTDLSVRTASNLFPGENYAIYQWSSWLSNEGSLGVLEWHNLLGDCALGHFISIPVSPGDQESREPHYPVHSQPLKLPPIYGEISKIQHRLEYHRWLIRKFKF